MSNKLIHIILQAMGFCNSVPQCSQEYFGSKAVISSLLSQGLMQTHEESDRCVASWRSLSLQVRKLELCNSHMQGVSSNHQSTSIANRTIYKIMCIYINFNYVWIHTVAATLLILYIDVSWIQNIFIPQKSFISSHLFQSSEALKLWDLSAASLHCNVPASAFRPWERSKNLTSMSRVGWFVKANTENVNS